MSDPGPAPGARGRREHQLPGHIGCRTSRSESTVHTASTAPISTAPITRRSCSRTGRRVRAHSAAIPRSSGTGRGGSSARPYPLRQSTRRPRRDRARSLPFGSTSTTAAVAYEAEGRPDTATRLLGGAGHVAEMLAEDPLPIAPGRRGDSNAPPDRSSSRSRRFGGSRDGRKTAPRAGPTRPRLGLPGWLKPCWEADRVGMRPRSGRPAPCG